MTTQAVRCFLPPAEPDDAPNRPADDTCVEHPALMAEIVELVLQLLESIELARTVGVLDLRPSCESWSHQMAEVVERDLLAQLRDVPGLLGPGPHEREV